MSTVSRRCTRTSLTDRKRVILYYSQIADDYDKLRLNSRKSWLISNLQTRWFIGQVAAIEGTILEIGSGTGRVTLPLAAHTGRIVAIDSSLKMVMRLREKCREQNVTNVALLVCDSHWLPFREGTFDSVVASRVFWHIANLNQPIAQALKALKQAGPIVFDFPNSSGAFRILAAALRHQEVTTLFFTSSSIHKLLSLPDCSITIEGQVSPLLYLWPESIFPRGQALRSLLLALERLGRTRVFRWTFTYLMVNLRTK